MVNHISLVILNKIFSAHNQANPSHNKCEGWAEVDYESEMRKKEGLVHPLRTRLYRGYVPNELSIEKGMPHSIDINKQHAANKRKHFHY